MELKTAIRKALAGYNSEKDKITDEFIEEIKPVVAGVSAVPVSVEEKIKAALWLGFLLGKSSGQGGKHVIR